MGHTAQSSPDLFADSRMLLRSAASRLSGQRTGDRGLRVWDIATPAGAAVRQTIPAGAPWLPTSRTAARSSPPAETVRPWSGTSPTWPIAARQRWPISGCSKPSGPTGLGRRPAGYRLVGPSSRDYRAVPPRSAPSRRGQEPATGPQVLRLLRAIAALERIGTPPAREVLEALARGVPDAPTTRDAADALLRLSRGKTHPPASRTTK